MPEYQIMYFDDTNLLKHRFPATCDSDQRAKVLAHAMKVPSTKTLQVWRDRRLIYSRPDQSAALPITHRPPAHPLLRTPEAHILKQGNSVIPERPTVGQLIAKAKVSYSPFLIFWNEAFLASGYLSAFLLTVLVLLSPAKNDATPYLVDSTVQGGGSGRDRAEKPDERSFV